MRNSVRYDPSYERPPGDNRKTHAKVSLHLIRGVKRSMGVRTRGNFGQGPRVCRNLWHQPRKDPRVRATSRRTVKCAHNQFSSTTPRPVEDVTVCGGKEHGKWTPARIFPLSQTCPVMPVTSATLPTSEASVLGENMAPSSLIFFKNACWASKGEEVARVKGGRAEGWRGGRREGAVQV